MTDEVLIILKPDDTVTFTETIDQVVTVGSQVENVVISEATGDVVIIQEVGAQGPKGDAGMPGIGLITIAAGEAISGGKAVVVGSDGKAYVFNVTNENHYGKVCGIAKQAALADQNLDVYVTGVVEEVGSGWQAGQVYYAGLNGILTPTPPSIGIIKLIGVGIATDTILINNTLEIITI